MTYTETPIHLRPLTELGPEIGGRGKDGGRRTTGRRKEKDPDFPPVYRINGRGYVEAGAWEIYKRLLMARGMEKTAERRVAAHPRVRPRIDNSPQAAE